VTKDMTLDFWKNMALGLKDQLVERGDTIQALEAEATRLTALVEEATAANLALGQYIADHALAALEQLKQPATGQQGQWEPLEPGVHTHAKGSAIVDEDGTFVLTHTMSMAQMFGDEKFVEESPFRLCRLTKPPQSTT
jgi:hypothetical protein